MKPAPKRAGQTPGPAGLPPLSEDQYRRLAEELPAITYIVELRPFPHTIYISPQVLPLLGFTQEEWLAAPEFWIQQLAPQDCERVVDEVRHHNHTGEAFFLEYRVRAKDGRTVWVRNSATYQRDNTGRPAAVHGVMLDVTARKEAEERLNQLTNCLLAFGGDADANVNAVVATCGETLGAACALYNRMEAGLLCSLGQWQPPPGFPASGKPEGYICFDVIQRADDQPLVIRNLPATRYAQSDRHVLAYGLQTYIGVAVKCRSRTVGSLCVVYQRDLEPSAEQLDFLRIASYAIAVEEERKQAAWEAQQTEQRHQRLYDLFRNMFDVMPDLLWAKDLDKKYIFANRAMCEQLLCARSPEEVVGQTDLFFAQRERSSRPDDPRWHTFGEICADSDSLVIESGQSHRLEEYGNVRGRYLHLDVIKTPLRNEQGELIGTIGAARDITERKAVEEALQQSDSRYRAYVNFAVDGILVGSPEGVILETNERMCAIVGRPREEIIGKPIQALFSPEVLEQTPFRFDLLKQGETVQRERKIIRPDGSEVLVEMHTKRMPDGTYQSIYHDVTERKRAEAALRAASQRMALHAERTPMAVIEWNLDFRVTRWNPAAERIFGFPAQEAVGQHAFFIVPDEVRPQVEQMWQALLNRTGGDKNTNPNRRKDGAEILCEWYNTPLVDEHGVVVGVASLAQDITARAQAEEERRERDANYFDLFNTVKQAIYIQNPDSTFVIVNQGAVDMYGYAREEFVGRTPEFLAAPGKNDLAKLGPILERAFQGQPQKFEFWGRKKDGTIFPKDVWTVKGRYFGKDVLISLASDITERKRAEDQLRESERLLEESQVIAHLGSYALDIQTGRWESSEMLDSLFGIGRTDEHSLTMWQDLVHPEDRAQMVDHFRNEVLDQGQPFDKEYRIIRRGDQAVRWVHGLGKLEFDAAGKPAKMIGTIQDITERKRVEIEKALLEDDLHQARKMESIGRLAGGIAHDFNNILQAILGNLELALEQAPPDQPIHHDLLEVQSASLRAADLTRQLLTFARKQTVVPRALDLNQTLENMLKMLRRLIGEDVKLVWTPGADLWPVRMDPTQTDQILSNLCVNARDAMGGAGEVLIETRNVHVDELNAARHEGFVPGDYVLLMVSDTGCGMGKETQERIFEPFFTTKDMGKGTGLGLSTVYGIVRQNQGHIAVYSELEKGTTFRIYLPRLRDAAAAPAAEFAPDLIARGSETLLLVEDDLAILKLTTRIVEQQGYVVLAANTPAEALRLAKDHRGPIHLLLTDIVMPGMNGRELSERLLAIRPGLKCLFMSGYTANVIARQGMLEAGVHFIQKPFSMGELDVRIRSILAGG